MGWPWHRRLERRRAIFGAVAPAVLIAMAAAVAGYLATSPVQQDFAAYYTAGAAVSAGLDPYVNQGPAAGTRPWDGLAIYQHSRFLYPALVADIFRPLAALPYAVAKIVFTVLSALALLVAVVLVRRDQRDHHRGGETGPWPWWCWAVWPPVFVGLERGQIDLLLLAALVGAWRCRDRPLPAGALLGASLFCKPLLVGVIPLLFAVRRTHWGAATVGALLVLSAANVLIDGALLSGKYLTDVLPRAAKYGEGGPEALLLPDHALASVAGDLDAGLARINGEGPAYPAEVGHFGRNASLSRLMAGDGVPSPLLCGVLFLMAAAALGHFGRRAPEDPAWFWGVLLAAVLAAPVSWAMELVWALPLMSIAAARKASAAPLARARLSRGLIALAWAAALAGPFFTPAWVLTALVLLVAAVVHLSAQTTRLPDPPLATEAAE